MMVIGFGFEHVGIGPQLECRETEDEILVMPLRNTATYAESHDFSDYLIRF